METIYDVFKQQVTAQTDAVAVMDEKKCLTYSELDAMATEIADGFPVKQPAKVGIVMSHSVEMIATILAALKSGAAYVPAEPSFPKERIKYMMEDCDFVVTDKGIQHIHNNINKVSDLAYILYTSGTTGKPKGVMVTNKNVLHYVCAFQHEFHPQPGDRMLQHSVCSFDIFVEEVFTTLLSGATLCIPSEETKADIHRLMDYIECHQVTMLSSFPYLLLEMNKLPRIPRSLRLLISGGDVIRDKYIDHLTPFMIPEFFVTMPSLPMTPNGKVDRRALPIVRKEGRLYA